MILTLEVLEVASALFTGSRLFLLAVPRVRALRTPLVLDGWLLRVSLLVHDDVIGDVTDVEGAI